METNLQNIANQRSSSKKDFLLPLTVLGGFFVVALLGIGVYGNFPLNDDWMYGLEVQRMLETGQLHLYGGSPSCALHIVIATIVCKLFGFSFVVLRSCGLAFGLACSFLAWAILRQLRISNKSATLAAFVLASNPLFLNLTFGYMTDVPALTFCFAYILFFIIGMKNNRVWPFLLSGVALLCALAVRQNCAIFIACNLLITAVYALNRQRKALIIFAALVAAPLCLAYYLDHMMSVINDYPAAYDWYKHEIARFLRMSIQDPFSFCFLELVSVVRAGAYLGLFCSPLLVSMFSLSSWIPATTQAMPPSVVEFPGENPALSVPNERAPQVRYDILGYSFAAMLITLCGVTFLVWFQHKLMPFSPNLMFFPALGSLTIAGGRTDRHLYTDILLTAFSAVFSAALLFAIFTSFHRSALLQMRSALQRTSKHAAGIRAPLTVFLSSLCILSFAWSVFHTTIANLDRYFLFPFAMLVLLAPLSMRWLKIPVATAISIGLSAIVAAYSVAAEHDYLSWNRVRWQAIHDLERKNVSTKDLDGGLEYDYSNDPALSNDLLLTDNIFVNKHRGDEQTSKMRWWSINGERYIISFTNIPKRETIAKYPYWSILSRSQKYLFVSRALDSN